MGNRPEQIGKSVVLQEIGILQQRQQVYPLLGEVRFQLFKVNPADIKVYL